MAYVLASIGISARCWSCVGRRGPLSIFVLLCINPQSVFILLYGKGGGNILWGLEQV